jgi:hypothetical protein
MAPTAPESSLRRDGLAQPGKSPRPCNHCRTGNPSCFFAAGFKRPQPAASDRVTSRRATSKRIAASLRRHAVRACGDPDWLPAFTTTPLPETPLPEMQLVLVQLCSSRRRRFALNCEIPRPMDRTSRTSPGWSRRIQRPSAVPSDAGRGSAKRTPAAIPTMSHLAAAREAPAPFVHSLEAFTTCLFGSWSAKSRASRQAPEIDSILTRV